MSLRGEGVVKSFGDRLVLDAVSIEVCAGEATALLGPSGSGKSTLLNILGALEPPDAGSVTFDGIDVLALRGRDLDRYRASSVGFVFQEHHLLPQLSALENAQLPNLAVGKSDPNKAAQLLEELGLGPRMHDLPARLSGGERQRVALARALANDPPVLLCDEPTGSLDQASGDALIELLLRQSRRGRAVLVVTHNQEQAERFDRVLRLRDGRLA